MPEQTSSPTRHDDFRRALALHRQGRLAEAERLYRQALKGDPRHAEALHMLGLIALQSGKAERALDLIGQSLTVNPQAPTAHYNLGNAQIALNRPREALASFAVAVALKPDFTVAHNNRGLALLQLGDAAAAVASFDCALLLHPVYADAHYNRANALRRLGRLDEAIAGYDAAIAANPRFIEAHNNQGLALLDAERFDDALAVFDRVLALNPDAAAAHSNRGNTLQRLGRYQEALESYDAALRVDPSNAWTHYNRGNALRALGRSEEAIVAYDAALAINPDLAEAHTNRGLALHDLGQLEAALDSITKGIAANPDSTHAHYDRGLVLQEMRRPNDALEAYRRSAALDPNMSLSYNNMGMVLRELGRIDESIDAFDTAVACDPDFVDAHFNRSLSYLLKRDFAAGWREYEWRRRQPKNLRRYPRLPAPADGIGDPPVLAGRSVLLYQEQGLGDEIMFASMIGDAARLAKRLVLMGEPRLKGLFARSFPGVTVLADGVDPAPEDVDAPHLIASLARLFRNRHEDFPGTAYLTADPARLTAMKARLATLGSGPKFGIMWRGGIGGKTETQRSLSLTEMSQAMDSAYHWISLSHLKTAADEIAAFTAATGIVVHHWPEILQSDDYDDTAALLAALDAVFSVTCTIGHCSGALGVPAHILVPQSPEWRYGIVGQRMPWYASMTLHRQADDGSWPFAEVRAALAGIAGRR